jgi:hypothetical protein
LRTSGATRPDFENIHKPHHSLQFLIKHCWDAAIIERPTAENVLDKLEKHYTIYNAKYWQKMRDCIGLYHFEVIIQL